jgi:hypothetical protein
MFLQQTDETTEPIRSPVVEGRRPDITEVQVSSVKSSVPPSSSFFGFGLSLGATIKYDTFFDSACMPYCLIL